MTKKFILISLGLLATFAVGARSLSPEEALARVTSDNQSHRVAGAVTAAPRLMHTALSRAGEPAAYVFAPATGSGFMVVSADDSAAPLLGYGDSNLTAAGEMPPQLQWWLGQYAAEIEAASASSIKYVNTSATATTADREPIKPLVKTLWNQDAPYYNLCPKIGSSYTYTGCVATAMAQVMKYFNYPDKGKGSGSATVIDAATGQIAQTLTMNLGVTFSWDDMLNEYKPGEYTDAQASAVARLMKACGYSVDMQYSTTESGAQATNVAAALVDHFNYDKACETRERINYTLADWEEMVYENLRTTGPVLYAGVAPTGGHAFVCDGYSSDHYFHFNWGWGGDYDGYFRLTALEPEGLGIGGHAGGFNQQQVGIFNIRKPVEGSEFPVQRLTQVTPMAVEDAMTRLNITGGWANYTGRNMVVDFSLEFTPVNGGTNQYLHIEYYSIGPSKGVAEFSIKKSDLRMLENGVTYECRVVFRDSDTGPWLQVLNPINVPNYALFTRNGTTFDITTPSPEMLTCTQFEFLSPVYYNAMGNMSYTVTNETNQEVPANIAVGMLDTTGKVAITTAGTFLDLMPGESYSTDQTTFSFSGDASSLVVGGKYTMVLYDTLSGAILRDLGLVAFEGAPATTLVLNDFKFIGDASNATIDDLSFMANVTCSKGYYGNMMLIGVYTNAIQPAYVVAMPTSNASFIKEGETADVPMTHFDLSAYCKLNTYYIAIPAYFKLNSLTNQMEATPFTEQHVVRFRATTTGIDVIAPEDTELSVLYNAQMRSAVAAGPAEITDIKTYSAAGALYQAPVSYSGTSAVIDLSAAPSGLTIVVATDAAGNTVTSKVMVP